MERSFRARLAIVAIVAIVVGCGSPSPSRYPNPSPTTGAPSASPAATTQASAPNSSPAVVPSASGQPVLGAVVQTVSNSLRVRSLPVVSDDSVKYEPLLPTGTELQVVGGPVDASGYTWYQVEPLSMSLDGGVERGWVASADHDGTPWIAVAQPPIAGLDVAMSTVDRAPGSVLAAKSASTWINAFAVDLYERLLTEEAVTSNGGNAVFSPTSIALALGMVRAGARGATAYQMDQVMHTRGRDPLGPELNSLDQALGSRNASWTDDESAKRQLALHIANTTFAQRDWGIEQPFLDTMAADFGSGVNLVDYAADPAAARGTINDWVKRRTEGRIPELLLPPDVSPLTRLYLVNAIYLKAEWEKWFEEDSTVPKAFTRLDGSKVQVPTMVGYRAALDPIAPFVKGKGYRAVELAYNGPGESRPLAMTVIMPDDLVAFERSLTADQLQRIARKLDLVRAGWRDQACPKALDTGCYPYDLTLYMPKFSSETRADLVKLLQGLGMTAAFDQRRADFTGIHQPTDPSDNIYISSVIHQANIEVDEHGTEAAAATAVGADTGGGPSPLKRITLRLDHPFLYMIRDVKTGAIVFMGRVTDPSLGS